MIIYPIYSRMWTVWQFSVFLVFSFIEDCFFLVQQKNEMKKENTLKYFDWV